MADLRDDSPLGSGVAAHVEAIVRAAEREARSAEQAIAARRRAAEEEVERYLAAARLRVDAEAAARAARLEALSGTARRLADELSDAAAALTAELRRDDAELLPPTPWPRRAGESPAPPAAESARPADRQAAPAASPAPPRPAPAPEPAQQATWARADELPADPFPAGAAAPSAPAEPPNAARLVAIEMAVGGSSRSEVEAHLREQFGEVDARPLLDDVFGAESHAASRLAWGEP